MIYIYDTLMAPNQTEFSRYGTKYKLDKITRMGEHRFYYFKSEGSESLVVVPRFVGFYTEIATRLARVKKHKTFDEALRYIRANVGRNLEIDEMPDDDSESGVTEVVNVTYKDVLLTIEYKNHELALVPSFQICKNNIFGNHIMVAMDINQEDT